jgi:hypothetical protein
MSSRCAGPFCFREGGGLVCDHGLRNIMVKPTNFTCREFLVLSISVNMEIVNVIALVPVKLRDRLGAKIAPQVSTSCDFVLRQSTTPPQPGSVGYKPQPMVN